jgi:uncharacterized damage-inducible protein DinB
MHAMTPDQAAFLLQTYLGTLKVESRTTRSVLQAVPADRADYRPDACSKSALELVRHIAASDIRFVQAVTTGMFSTSAVIPDSAQTPAEIAAWYEEQYATNFEALTKLTPDQLVKVVDFRGLFQRPAVTFLMFGLHHTIHHRGQLSAYLRAMGGKVPAIYGESFDSAAAKSAAPV